MVTFVLIVPNDSKCFSPDIFPTLFVLLLNKFIYNHVYQAICSQEDFLLMEQKWLAEQKRKKYFEEQAVIEEKKAREISHQLYMIMTNELTPANIKVS